ncbi:tetratricopeptide repeat protein, partial [bacterium]
MKKRMIVIVLFVGLFIPGSTFAETAKEYTQGYNYLDEAISEFTRAIENSPNYAGAYYNRAVAYIHKGNYDQAISDCTKAIELKPNYAEAYYFRGVAYGGKGNSVQEASDYARAAELKPELNPKYVKSNKGLGLA